MITLSEDFLAKELPVVHVFCHLHCPLSIDVSELGIHIHHVEQDLVDLKHSKHVRATEFEGFSLSIFKLQSIQNGKGDVNLLNRLFQSRAIIVDSYEMVPEETALPDNHMGKGIVLSIDGARSEDGRIWESDLDCLFSMPFGLEIERGRVGISSGSREMDEPHDSLFRASLGNPLSNVNIHILEILLLLKLSPRPNQINNNIRVLDHILNEPLISQIGPELHPSLIYMK